MINNNKGTAVEADAREAAQAGGDILINNGKSAAAIPVAIIARKIWSPSS